MRQLIMKAVAPYPLTTRSLPEGYRFVRFCGAQKDVDDWKKIIVNPPAPPDEGDSCYHLMIETYPDVVPEKDIFFIENAKRDRVGTFTAVTHRDGSGYLHMVKAALSERGKGLGHCMAEFSLDVFRDRETPYVILTTDDFRLPAIKTYLDAGFLPVIPAVESEETERRWDLVLKQLDYPIVQRIRED